ncbi:putative immunity protein [Actinomycetospora aurantiaca]|uniref:putative immunity protein n=1 Tax=Actinomycetospora aurantiaca TaxID=3129233 RepID=UPI00359F251B
MELALDELRAVTAFAVVCARTALPIVPHDEARPGEAVDAARAFAEGGRRTKAIRDGAWAAQRAATEARDDGRPAASEAARAAVAAAGAAYLHPLARAKQVRHILGAAAHAARALELVADDPGVGDAHVRALADRATPVVVEVLCRYPRAPAGGGRVGELVRVLDVVLRQRSPRSPERGGSEA